MQVRHIDCGTQRLRGLDTYDRGSGRHIWLPQYLPAGQQARTRVGQPAGERYRAAHDRRFPGKVREPRFVHGPRLSPIAPGRGLAR